MFRKYRRRTAVAELAVVAPVFFLLMFDMVERGHMVMVQQSISQAAKEGAQAASDDAAPPELTKAVETRLHESSLTDADVTVEPDPHNGAVSGDPVTIAVSIDFADVSWWTAPMLIGDAAMSTTVSMRRERMN